MVYIFELNFFFYTCEIYNSQNSNIKTAQHCYLSFQKQRKYINDIISYLVMSEILKTIDYLKSIQVGDYVQYNEDKFGYVIEIIDNEKF